MVRGHGRIKEVHATDVDAWWIIYLQQRVSRSSCPFGSGYMDSREVDHSSDASSTSRISKKWTVLQKRSKWTIRQKRQYQ